MVVTEITDNKFDVTAHVSYHWFLQSLNKLTCLLSIDRLGRWSHNPKALQVLFCSVVTAKCHDVYHLLSNHLKIVKAKVSNYTRTRIELLHKQGLLPAEIFRPLKAEGLLVSIASVVWIINKFRITGSVANLPRSGRPTKVSEGAKAFIDRQMREDNKMTSSTIQKKLAKGGIVVSSATVRRSPKQLGWTLKRTGYCQLIWDVNKTKRLEFAQSVLESGDTFHNVIFSDESSISLTQYWSTCYRKADELAKRKPKHKHLQKVHVWAGIICATKNGIMDANLFCNITETTLVPFIQEKLPDHRFVQDNDLKNTSRWAKAFFEENNINWWRSPPESPDLISIKNLWHELKFYLESKVKPCNKQELVDGIKRFWERKVTVKKCTKYIDHVLYKAIPATLYNRVIRSCNKVLKWLF